MRAVNRCSGSPLVFGLTHTLLRSHFGPRKLQASSVVCSWKWRSSANSIIERPTAKSKFKYEHFQRKTATQRMNISSGRPLHDVTRRTTTRGWWLVLDRQRVLDKELALPVTILAQALASSELINSLAMGSSYDMQPAMHSISAGTDRFCTRL